MKERTKQKQNEKQSTTETSFQKTNKQTKPKENV